MKNPLSSIVISYTLFIAESFHKYLMRYLRKFDTLQSYIDASNNNELSYPSTALVLEDYSFHFDDIESVYYQSADASLRPTDVPNRYGIDIINKLPIKVYDTNVGVSVDGQRIDSSYINVTDGSSSIKVTVANSSVIGNMGTVPSYIEPSNESVVGKNPISKIEIPTISADIAP